jgi:hypothetical protein
MNDNIGGACVVVARDSRGRITHQAERNIYLPQPNWMVLFNGDSIDVGKLELIRYQRHRQQIFWRTVKSANDSALYDDGITTFEKNDRGLTRVTITARQEFTLPLFWQALNVDYAPDIKDALVTDAYTRFFSRTMANYEAAYEGRKVGTGSEPDPCLGETDADPGPLPLEQVVEWILKIAGWAAPAITAWIKGQRTHEDNEGDPNGHPDEGDLAMKSFLKSIPYSAQIVTPFIGDLINAVKKDMTMLRHPSTKGWL